MTNRGNLVLWGLLPLALLSLAMTAQAEVVDRTIAVVNNHLVTWSDLDEQMRFEALENRRGLKNLDEADRRAAFDHLVQYRILRDQMQGTIPANDSEVEARVADVRAGWHLASKDIKEDEKWAATLSIYGLSLTDLHELVMNQIEILRFMEYRVRPLVRVSRKEVEDYYTSTLVPEVKAQGQNPEPVELIILKIRELLVEQKMNREMEKWLESLRAQSRVQILWEGVR